MNAGIKWPGREADHSSSAIAEVISYLTENMQYPVIKTNLYYIFF
jgi:predicted metalloprotease